MGYMNLLDGTTQIRVYLGTCVPEEPWPRGRDTGRKPEAMFVTAVAASAAQAARRLLTQLELPTRGLRIDCSYDVGAPDPTCITAINLSVHLPPGVPTDKEGAVISAIFQSSLYSTLRMPPAVNLRVVQPEAA